MDSKKLDSNELEGFVNSIYKNARNGVYIASLGLIAMSMGETDSKTLVDLITFTPKQMTYFGIATFVGTCIIDYKVYLMNGTGE